MLFFKQDLKMVFQVISSSKKKKEKKPTQPGSCNTWKSKCVFLTIFNGYLQKYWHYPQGLDGILD